MKAEVYVCDRCGTQFNVESGRTAPTIEYVDGRFSNEEKETIHLCDDCWITFLYATTDQKKERIKAFDKLAGNFSEEDEKEA